MVDKIIWLGQALHRWLIALLTVGVVGIEGFMHLVGIPHVEGWWLPLLGGGSAVVTTAVVWLQRTRRNKQPPVTAPTE